MDEITIDSFSEIKPGTGERFKRFLRIIQKTPGEIAKEIKEPVSFVMDIQAEKITPGIPLANLLYNLYGLNGNWLLEGEGNVFQEGGFMDDQQREDDSAMTGRLLTGGGVEKDDPVYFSDIVGQEMAKRAMKIAAAGNHHLLMAGPPGCGKTMLLKALAGILPRGVSTARGNVLLLDDLHLIEKKYLDILKKSLDNENFMLVTAMSDCEDTSEGNGGGVRVDDCRECLRSRLFMKHYYPNLSRALLDRFDIKVKIDKAPIQDIIDKTKGRRIARAKSSAAVKKAVAKARKIQHHRFKIKKDSENQRVFANAQMDNEQALACWPLNNTPDIEKLFHMASDRMDLSVRGFFKVLKLSRTIADLDACPIINQNHVSEALEYYSFFNRGDR